MKKLIFSGLLLSLGFSTIAQTEQEKVLLKVYKDAKEKSDKDILNEKSKIKAKTWMDRALAYEDVAIRYMSLDSNAANVVVESYNKVIELDVKNGKEGSLAKDAKKNLTSKTLFNCFLQQGAGSYTNKNYKKAQESFKMASTIDPKDSVATMYWGVASQQLRDDPSMVEAYEKHISIGGKDPVVYYSLYSAYSKAGKDDKAVEMLTKGIELNPENKDLKAEKTNYFIKSGKTEQALLALKEMIAKEPNNVSNILNVAIIQDNLQINANTEIRKLAESLNNGSESQAKLDAKMSQVQAYTDERNRLKDQLKKQPKNADVKRRLAEAETFLKEQTDVLTKLKADKVAEDAKKVDPALVQKKIDALAKTKEENKTGAIEYYKKALAIDPKNYDALFNMGVMSFNDAVELKRPYDNMNPTSPEFKTNGKAIEDKFISKFKEALPFFESAFEMKKEVEVKENLRNLYRILKMEDKMKALGD